MYHTNADFTPASVFFVNRHSKAKASQTEMKFVKMNDLWADSSNAFCNDIRDSMKNTIWNNDIFHDPNKNYGTFEKLLVDAKDSHFKG